jgi:hypothetical protein
MAVPIGAANASVVWLTVQMEIDAAKKMIRNGPNKVLAIVGEFTQQHPELLETLQADLLQLHLEHVYDAVVRGRFHAKTDEELITESERCGITRQQYEALVNLAAHAAD